MSLSSQNAVFCLGSCPCRRCPARPSTSARLDSPTMESNGQFDFCILLDGLTCNECLLFPLPCHVPEKVQTATFGRKRHVLCFYLSLLIFTQVICCATIFFLSYIFACHLQISSTLTIDSVWQSIVLLRTCLSIPSHRR